MSTDVTRTRSLALLGHSGDGKTTLADTVVMSAAVSSRLGSVDDGTSFMNHLPEERKRRLSISTGICTFEHGGYSLALLDAPGDPNFAAEAQNATAAADCVALVVSAQDGPKLGTLKSFRLARSLGASICAVANKMDLERADYDQCAAQLEQSTGMRVVRLHLPIEPGPGYRGYVDLLSRKSYVFEEDTGRAKVSAPSPALASAVEEAHLAMVEAAAEADDAVLERYLEEGDLPEEILIATLRKGVGQGTLLPLLSACSARNIGGAAVLDLAERVLPSPAERAPRKARTGESEVEVPARADGPLVAYVFKSIADRYAGMLSVFRVISGTLHTDMMVANARTGAKERISKILRVSGENTEDAREVGPGQIAALAKLKDTRTGDTLCSDDKHPVRVLAPDAPVGVISFAVEAANKGEEDKVFDALHRLVEEDPSLTLGRDERTGEFLLTGLGQLHIEVTLEKLRRMFKVDIALKPPKVPYLETIRGRAQGVEGKLKKQSGGRGQFGVCYLNVDPGPRGSGVAFLDEIVGGAIPRNFIPAVEKGVRDTCAQGVIAGYPLTDIQVHCVDGKFHAVDSSEQAFKIAGSLGVRAAVQQAHPTLLEPIMKLHVFVPDEFVGDIMGNLNSRRGRVSGVESSGPTQSVSADVPMSEVLTYASDLTSITGGQGTFTMEFSHYEEVPKEVQERIVADAAARRQAE